MITIFIEATKNYLFNKRESEQFPPGIANLVVYIGVSDLVVGIVVIDVSDLVVGIVVIDVSDLVVGIVVIDVSDLVVVSRQSSPNSSGCTWCFGSSAFLGRFTSFGCCR